MKFDKGLINKKNKTVTYVQFSAIFSNELKTNNDLMDDDW